jgi:DNA-binding transcriptional ArsR family regulator
MERSGVRDLDDPRALRALAHPLRLRLLAHLRMEGPATASILGRALGESSGATSYHLRALARHGFVEDDAERRNGGRERWWRAAHRGVSWSLSTGDPGTDEAGRALLAQALREYQRRLERWVAELPDWPVEWQEAATSTDRVLRLPPARVRALGDELNAVLERYEAEAATGDDSEHVLAIVHTFPVREGGA